MASASDCTGACASSQSTRSRPENECAYERRCQCDGATATPPVLLRRRPTRLATSSSLHHRDPICTPPLAALGAVVVVVMLEVDAIIRACAKEGERANE